MRSLCSKLLCADRPPCDVDDPSCASVCCASCRWDPVIVSGPSSGRTMYKLDLIRLNMNKQMLLQLYVARTRYALQL